MRRVQGPLMQQHKADRYSSNYFFELADCVSVFCLDLLTATLSHPIASRLENSLIDDNCPISCDPCALHSLYLL